MPCKLLFRPRRVELTAGLIPGLSRRPALPTGCSGESARWKSGLPATKRKSPSAQEIRYRVFYEELGARSNRAQSLDRRDADRFDPVCDHILVFDHALPGPEHERIVGTYRILRQDGAALAGGFYSEDEFDLRR